MPPCTSANTFCVVCTREEEVDERGLLGFLGMHDPLDWDPDPQAASPEPSVSTSHKSTRLCRIVNREFKKKKKKKKIPLICFPSSRWGQVFYSCEEYTKESTIITAVIDHYGFSPIRALVNRRTKSLPKQPACPGANNRAVHHASLYQQLVNWILWHTVKFTVFSAALPLSSSQQSPQTDPEAQQHLALPLLIMGEGPV